MADWAQTPMRAELISVAQLPGYCLRFASASATNSLQKLFRTTEPLSELRVLPGEQCQLRD
jgi:hypothetical protein